MTESRMSTICLQPKLWFCVVFLVFPLYSSSDAVIIDLLVPADGSTTPDTRPASDPFINHVQDSSIPLPTQFVWSVQGNSRPFTYEIFISEDSIFDTTDIIASDLADTALPVWNLKINTAYLWKIRARDSLNSIVNSAVFSFKTPDVWPRMIYIDGTMNVRDIGGWPNKDGKTIRQGIFYRSAAFDGDYPVTPLGLSQLFSLGIVCEIDLRRSDENPQIVMPWLLHYVRPMTGSGDGVGKYLDGLQNTQGPVRDIFRAMADTQNYPMVLHCHVGADRTGTIAALVEALLGCSEQQMGLDFIWTSLSLNARHDTTSTDWHDVISYLKSFDTQDSTVQAGAWYYLQTVGVSVAELMAIRKFFLNDDRQPYPELSVDYRIIPGRHARCSPVCRFVAPSTQHAIVVKKGVRRVQLYTLSGKKIGEYSRACAEASGKIKTPLMAPGAYIIYEAEETIPQ
jgi:protein-tyrosine phosphatase